jgi:hypothetical protein
MTESRVKAPRQPPAVEIRDRTASLAQLRAEWDIDFKRWAKETMDNILWESFSEVFPELFPPKECDESTTETE